MHKKSLEAAAHLENGEIDKESNDDDRSEDACSPDISNSRTDHPNGDKLCVYHYDDLHYVNNNNNNHSNSRQN